MYETTTIIIIIVVVIVVDFVVFTKSARSLCTVQIIPLVRVSIEHRQTSLSNADVISAVVRLVRRPVVVPQRSNDVVGASLLLLLLLLPRRQLPDERTDT